MSPPSARRVRSGRKVPAFSSSPPRPRIRAARNHSDRPWPRCRPRRGLAPAPRRRERRGAGGQGARWAVSRARRPSHTSTDRGPRRSNSRRRLGGVRVGVELPRRVRRQLRPQLAGPFDLPAEQGAAEPAAPPRLGEQRRRMHRRGDLLLRAWPAARHRELPRPRPDPGGCPGPVTDYPGREPGPTSSSVRPGSVLAATPIPTMNAASRGASAAPTAAWSWQAHPACPAMPPSDYRSGPVPVVDGCGAEPAAGPPGDRGARATHVRSQGGDPAAPPG